MTWLVTGGAGYIGSHVVRAFGEVGLSTVVLDDLSSGHKDFVPSDVPLVEGSILDTDLVADTLSQHGVVGVVHLAGFKYAGVSVSRPLHTYEQNVTGTVHLLEAMASQGVDAIVFSSSAAVYGTPDVDLVTESTATRPESPYGESKLIGEWLLRRPGPGHRAAAHVPAVLQRRRLRHGRPLRHEPAQPVPAGARRPGRGAHAAHQRHRLPDAGRDLRPRLPARRRPGRLARHGRAGARRGPHPRARLQPRLRRRQLRARDHDGRRSRPRASTSSPSSHPAAPATPRGSSPPASSRPATSTGRCGTPCSTWSPAPGRPGRPTDLVSAPGPRGPAAWGARRRGRPGRPVSPRRRPRREASARSRR